MKDPLLVEQREKIFDQYRETCKQLTAFSGELETMRNRLREMQDEYTSTVREKDYLNGLIQIMILNDCDPVEAKLKYDQEIRQEISEYKNEAEYALEKAVEPIYRIISQGR